MNFVQSIMETLSSIVGSFSTLLKNIFESVVDIFYTPGDNGGLTIVGTLMLVGLGTSLVMFGFRYIRSLIKVRTK